MLLTIVIKCFIETYILYSLLKHYYNIIIIVPSFYYSAAIKRARALYRYTSASYMPRLKR
ncbi:hypothetical protein GJV44_00744 [Candidatus Vallotia cooleyia]|nr:hypothetical protein GJV44_00744 [Candidatus Vallotia cooleyia]